MSPVFGQMVVIYLLHFFLGHSSSGLPPTQVFASMKQPHSEQRLLSSKK
jgi:hypothetical protein